MSDRKKSHIKPLLFCVSLHDKPSFTHHLVRVQLQSLDTKNLPQPHNTTELNGTVMGTEYQKPSQIYNVLTQITHFVLNKILYEKDNYKLLLGYPSYDKFTNLACIYEHTNFLT